MAESRIRACTTRCARCDYYVCTCGPLKEKIGTNHFDWVSKREKLQLDEFILVHPTIRCGKWWDESVYKLKGGNMGKFVLKRSDKSRAKELSQNKHVQWEKEVMCTLSEQGTWITDLFQYMETERYLYLFTEFCQGGELGELIAGRGVLEVEETKFYAAQAYSAVVFLREHSVIHRDVKPENFLIDSRGFLKLSGFGFAKSVKDTAGRAFTLVGTVNYMAPEMFRGGGYTYAVDWWGLGALIYEMCQGVVPFFQLSPTELVEMHKRNEEVNLVRNRHCVDARIWDLVSKLLTINQKERLRFGVEEFKGHALFRFYKKNKFRWSFKGEDMKPPFIPPSADDRNPLYRPRLSMLDN